MVQPFLVAKILQYIQTGEVDIGLGIRSGIVVAVIPVISIFAYFTELFFYHVTLFALPNTFRDNSLVFKKSLNLSSAVRSRHHGRNHHYDVYRFGTAVVCHDVAEWLWMVRHAFDN